MYQTIQTEFKHGVALIWLNRPELRNAMDDTMIGELIQAVQLANEDPLVRVILLAGRGKGFCAGGDLNWMKRARQMNEQDAIADSAQLANLFKSLYESAKPTVARVHGTAFAGAMGLVSACDIAIASTDAKFCLSEVKLGLIPSTISPYVIKAMGERQARRYFLSAEVFNAAEAYRIGLVSDICELDELDAKVNAMIGQLLLGGPKALHATKRLIQEVSGQAIGPNLSLQTAHRIAKIRASDEAQEGMNAFLEKRNANWVDALEQGATHVK